MASNDFDFLVGKDWNIHNRVLKERLTGCEEWTEFASRLQDVRKILMGLGNIDRFVTTGDGEPFEAISLRLYNPEKERWTIYWADSEAAELVEQVVGRFESGVGEFFGQEPFHGKTVKLRFRWTDITEHSGRWEQAYFDEQRQVWETNWIMEFTASAAA